jgi:hypothetical protein
MLRSGNGMIGSNYGSQRNKQLRNEILARGQSGAMAVA